MIDNSISRVSALQPGALVKYYSNVTLKSFFGLILGVNEGAGANGHQFHWVLTQEGVRNCYDGNLTKIDATSQELFK